MVMKPAPMAAAKKKVSAVETSAPPSPTEDVEFEFEDDFWEYLRQRLLRFSPFSCGKRMSMISGFGHLVFF